MNPINVKVCVDTTLLGTLVVTTELVTLVNTVDRVGSGRKSWSSILTFLTSPLPCPTIAQSVISPHPVKFIVGMMYCVFEKRVPVPVLSDGVDGIEGTSQVPEA